MTNISNISKYWTYKTNKNKKIMLITTFVGLTDKVTEGKWVWDSDGSETRYTNWESGQPDPTEEDCVEMTSSGKWHDVYCDRENHFAICQKP